MIDPESLDLSQFSSAEACPICGEKTRVSIGLRPTIHPAPIEMRVEVVKCRACGHWYTDPSPDQAYLSSLYASASPSVVGGDGGQSVTQEFKTIQQKFNRKDLKKFAWIVGHAQQHKPTRYLEIGIGNGLLLEFFRANGADCTAVEPGDWARQAQGIFSSIAQIPQELSFDTIAATDVLEHMSDPGSDFIALAAKLGSAGHFYVSVPNADSFRARTQGTQWRMVRPLGHLHYFSRQSLRLLAERAGLEVVALRSHDAMDRGFLGTLLDFVSQTLKLRFKRAFDVLVQLVIFHPIQLMGKGDQWTLIARKKVILKAN
jgi:hypothetical protein